MQRRINFYADNFMDDNNGELLLRQAVIENSAEFKQAEKVKKIANEEALAAQAAALQQSAQQTAVVPTIVNRIERMSGQEWTNVLLIVIIILLVLILIFK